MSRRDAAGTGRVDRTGRGGGRMGAGRVDGTGRDNGRMGAGAARRGGGSGRPDAGRCDGGRASWHGTALLVEALVLLTFLVASLALFMQAFAQARGMGAEGSQLAQAVAMASNLAEEFAADPAAEPEPLERDGLTASCAVATVAADDVDGADGQTGPDADDAPSGGSSSDSSGAAGTLYRATILVTDGDGDEVYRLVTERYARGAATSGHGDDAAGTDGDTLVEAAADGGASTGTASAADDSAADSPSPADGDASPSPVDNASPSDQGEVI